MAYYTPSGQPALDNRGISAQVRSEFALIAAGFALLPVSAAIFSGYSNYYAATGTASAFAITVSANVTTIPDGATFLVTAPATNTGALTIAISYAPVPTLIGTYTVGRPDGTALVAGDWVSGQIGQISFNVTSGKFQLALSALTAANAAATSAAAAATSASASATSATASAASATASAASATAAANYLTIGTSTSSVAIGTGPKSFTATVGKTWGDGQFLTLASAANSANYMHGTVATGGYNPATGALSMNILDIGGSGTFADWNIAISGTQGATGPSGAVSLGRKLITGTDTLVAADLGKVVKCSGTVGSDYTVTLSAAATLGANWFVSLNNEGTCAVTLSAASIDGATTKLVQPGDALFIQCSGTDIVTQRMEGDGAFGAVSGATVLNAATSSGFISACGLTSTRGYVLRKGASSFPFVDLVSDAGAVISTTAALESVAVSGVIPQIRKVDASRAIAVWGNGTPSVRACMLSFSGSVITVGTVIELEATTSAGSVSVAINSSTLATAAWGKSDVTAGIRARSITIGAGTTLTAGTTTYQLDSGGAPNMVRIAPISATQSLCTANSAAFGTNSIQGLILTNTAGVLTFPAAWAGLSYHAASASGQAIGDVIYTGSGLTALVAGGSGEAAGGAGLAYPVICAGTGTTASFHTGRHTPVSPAGKAVAATNGNRLDQVSSRTYVRALIASDNKSLSLEVLYLDNASAVRAGKAVALAVNAPDFDLAVIGSSVVAAYTDGANSNFPTIKSVALGTVA